jgi:hypothetical protein
VPTLPIAGSDFPPLDESVIRGGALGWPHLWTDLFFGFSLTYWASTMPLWALAAPLHALGAPFAVIERIFWLWPVQFGAPLCGYYLCYRFTHRPYAAAIGASLFAINSWTIGLVERGHIPSLEAFALSGIILPLALGFAARPSVRLALLLALFVSVQILFDPRYGYESTVILLLVTAVSAPRLLRRKHLRPLLQGGSAFFAALLVLNLDTILPSLAALHLPAGWGTPEALLSASHFGSLLAAFSLYFPFYRWVIGTDGFAQSNPEPAFIAVALLAWLGLLLARRRMSCRFLLGITVCGIIFVSGTSGPFAPVIVAFFQHFPGFALFRDVSKINGLIVPGYAVGVSLAFAAAARALRRAPVALGQAEAVLAIALSFAYLFVMRDALNPLRQSNFAGAAQFTPAGEATERFLSDNLGDARAVMFPGDVRFQRRGQFIAAADATSMAANPPPLGFALLNSNIAGPDLLLQLFASPLAPALLRELRVKYIVVPDDRGLYYRFDGRTQRWASLDFLRQQRWLREVTHFGSNVIFEPRGNLAPPAFFAPYPALIVGSPATLEGLVGSPLWTDRAAALVYEQAPRGAEWLSSLPNVVEGPTLIDPQFGIGAGGPAAASRRLSEIVASERYRQTPFSAEVFSSAMLTKSLLSWNFDSPFAFRFQTNHAAGATFSFLMERRKALPSTLIRNSGIIRSAGADRNGTIVGSAIACSESAVWHGSLGGGGSTLRVGADEAGKQVFVNNPCPVAYQGSVSFRATSGDALPLLYTITYGNIIRQVSAPPLWLSPFNWPTVTLPDVVLRPGFNLFALNKSDSRAFSIDSAYAISDLHQLDETFRPYPLQLSVKRSQVADLVYGSIDVPRAGMHVGYLDLTGTLDLPLDRHPLCTLKYSLANVPGSFDLVLDLRNRNEGTTFSLWVPIAQKQNADYDLYGLVRDALEERFQNDVAYHSDDPLWTAEHFADGALSADEFTLRSVRVAAEWSVFGSSDIPHGTFVALFSGIRLAAASELVGKSWAYPQTSRVSMAAVSAHNFRLLGMKLLHVSSTSGGEPRVDAELSGYVPSGYRLAASLHVGDFVALVLQNGQRVQGTIVAESSDYVLIQDGDNPPQRVARGSVSTVTQQEITRSAKLEIPIASPFQPTNLTFDVRSDEDLKVRIALTYEGPGNVRETIPAVDREDIDLSGADVDPAFIKPGTVTSATVFDLSVPIDLTLAEPPLSRITNYDLDLWNIERYHFGASSHRLVGLTVGFTELPNVGPIDRQISVAVANLTVSRDRLLRGDPSRSAIGVPLVTLDGTPVSIKRTNAVQDAAAYFSGSRSAGLLEAGNHVVASIPLDELRVRAAMLSRGTPAHYYAGRVSQFRRLTPSEFAGSLSGAGVLVVPQSYDAGWELALWPPGASEPGQTTFALLDWLRSLAYALPQTDHVPVNTNIDAWHVAPGTPGERHFLMLYIPEALSELGFLFTLLGIALSSLWWRRILWPPAPGR